MQDTVPKKPSNFKQYFCTLAVIYRAKLIPDGTTLFIGLGINNSVGGLDLSVTRIKFHSRNICQRSHHETMETLEIATFETATQGMMDLRVHRMGLEILQSKATGWMRNLPQ